MAKCAVCGKGAHFGNNVSHSHRRSNRMWKSNIKRVSCKVNGTPKKLYVCASCLHKFIALFFEFYIFFKFCLQYVLSSDRIIML